MKYLKYLLYALLIISSVLIIAYYASGFPDSLTTTLLNWSGVLIVVALLCAIILPFFFSSGKGIKSTLIKLGIIVVLCLISYLAATSDPLQVKVNMDPTATTLKLTDSGLILTCILLVAALLSILSGFVINAIRNR